MIRSAGAPDVRAPTQELRKTSSLKVVLMAALAVIVLLLAACGGSRAVVPITGREQSMEQTTECFDEVQKIADQEYKRTVAFRRLRVHPRAAKEFAATGKVDPSAVKQRNVIEGALAEMGQKFPELGQIVEKLAREAAKQFATRRPEVKDARYNCFSEQGINSLQILILEERDALAMSARYYPFGRIVLIADPQRFKEEAYANRMAFLIAHELAHGIAMHVEEQHTETRAMRKEAEEAARLAAEVALNEAYRLLREKSPEAAKAIDAVAAVQFETLGYTQADLDEDAKRAQERSESLAAKAARSAGQTDKLRLLGVDLEIPPKTKIVGIHYLKAGLDAAGVMEALQKTVDEAAFFVSSMRHDKDMEFEADHIGFKIYTAAGFPPAYPLAILEQEKAKQEKAGFQPSIFDAHPPAAERLEKLRLLAPEANSGDAKPLAPDEASGTGSDITPGSPSNASPRPTPTTSEAPTTNANPKNDKLSGMAVNRTTQPSGSATAGLMVRTVSTETLPAEKASQSANAGAEKKIAFDGGAASAHSAGAIAKADHRQQVRMGQEGQPSHQETASRPAHAAKKAESGAETNTTQRSRTTERTPRQPRPFMEPPADQDPPARTFFLAREVDRQNAQGWQDTTAPQRAAVIYEKLQQDLPGWTGSNSQDAARKQKAMKELRRVGMQLWMIGAIKNPPENR